MTKKQLKFKSKKNINNPVHSKYKKEYVKKVDFKKTFKKPSNFSSKNKDKKSFIENNNPILLHLEELFSLLYKGAYTSSYILNHLKLTRAYNRQLLAVLDELIKFALIKINSEKYKLNVKNIKEINLPKYFLLKVSKINSLGETLAVFPNFINNTDKYTLVLEKTSFALKENNYIIAKLNKVNNKILKGIVLSVLPEYQPKIIIGLASKEKKPYLIPLGRKYKEPFYICNSKMFNFNNNALLQAEIINDSKFQKEVNITKVLNNQDITQNLSLLTAYEFNLPLEFNKLIIEETNKKIGLPDLTKYKDLTSVPLVTIDGEDAKDFDDAVFVKQISNNPLRYKATIAIADVSSYVEPNSLLDQEALKRGNSSYLPSLVIPMLPTILSNTWCSLNPNEPRVSLAVDLIINNHGLIEEYKFYKALIKSKARLTYKEVDAALLGDTNEKTAPILEEIIKPLYDCWKLLNQAKIKRNALEIQANEYQVIFNKDKTVNNIEKKEELVSHKIIEELMIAANVAAAEFLKKHNYENVTIFRVHDKPSNLKLENFITVLKGLGISIKIPKTINQEFFNNLIKKYRNSNLYPILNECILSAQSQANYSTNNIGHFGLALKEYCHFTSPIRRYADLIIHRLITNILSKQKITNTKNDIQEIANNISITERNSAQAEYSAMEKIIAQLLSNKINNEFDATIVNITNAGIFVAIEYMGAQGLIPMRTLGSERFVFTKEKDKLIGINTKIQYKIGQKLKVILKEANTLKGLLTFLVK